MDGSVESDAAVRWATREAVMGDESLTLMDWHQYEDEGYEISVSKQARELVTAQYEFNRGIVRSADRALSKSDDSQE
ncbi:hypothetical protein CIW52_18190 [Mycolicibacterium sp. P9-64]|uniref:hypothetical protein n=1 Tax=Mycolicibacterium sp. P9-64 TaxID=2024612 RepID=UPI0011EE19AC|nr:hypothetical protein [Mycolicibacterium sp. P9-64]KAA0081680.1 hypothetical protein CIW52_18190 [Mycolicibacterium sp. P9-64]